MAVVFKNNAKTTLASSLTSSATSVTVADGSAFPSLSGGDTFFCTFDNGTNVEVVKVTARSSNTLTIVRAQDDTTARAFSTGAVAELRLTAGILNLFSQTGVAITDEIEAYLDANGTTFPDSVKAQFGASNDLQIYHNGSNSIIQDTGTGKLLLGSDLLAIRNSALNEDMLTATQNGAVKLFYDNSKKLETTSSGVQITGTLDVDVISNASGVVHLNDTLYFQDNSKAVFGDSSDLQIYHSGTHSYIQDSGTGNLYLGGSDLIWLGSGDLQETYATFNDDGAVTLRHDNSIKFETTSSGVDISGTITADGLTVEAASNALIRISDSTSANQRLDLQHNGGVSSIISGNNGAYGAIKLQAYNGTDTIDRLSINTAGNATFSGTITADGLDLGDGSVLNVDTIALDKIKGDADDNTNITFAGNDTTTFNQGGIQRLAVNTSGINVTGRATADGLTSEGTQGNWEIQDNGNIQAFSRAGVNYIRATNASGSLRFDTGGTTIRQKIASNGDISFYDNTGTTQGLFWDSSAERLGLGNTAPSKNLHITDSSSPTIRFSRDNSFYWDIGHTSSDFQFISESGGTVMHMNYDGNVGIATTSPNQLLSINSTASTARGISFDQSGAERVKLLYTNSSGAFVINNTTAGYTSFENNGSEAVRIDSSGNFLCGKTSASSASIGFQAGQDGFTAITRASAQPLVLNRTTNDGIIAEFKKDSTQVGSIGIQSSGFYIDGESAHTGLRFTSAGITPRLNGAESDNTVDLGESGIRFKDLYLSGAISSGAITSTGTSSFGGISLSGNIDINGNNIIDVNQINGVSATGWLDFNMDTDNIYPTGTTDNITVLGSITHHVFVGDANGNGVGGDFYWGYGVDQADTGTFTETMSLTKAGNLTVTGTINSGAITSTGELEATALDINGNGDISGNLTLGGYLAGPATFTIDPAAVGDNTGTVVIAGNLQVDGTTTTINSTTMTVDDLNLTLASGAANAAAANGAGITVDGASATITYDGTNDEWDFNKNVNVTGTVTSDGVKVGATDRIYLDGGSNTYIQESASDDLRFFVGGQQAVRVRTFGTDILGTVTADGLTVDGTISSGDITATKQISADTIYYPLIVAGIDVGNTVNQSIASGIGIQFKIAGNSSSGDSLIGASIVARREADGDSDSSTGLSFNVSQNNTTLDEALRLNHDQNAIFAGSIASGAITSTGTVQGIGIKHSNGNEVIELNDNVYTILRNPEGSNTLYMGDSGDSGNYYDNNHHNFRPSGGGTAWVRILSNGINVQSGGYIINGTTVIDSSRNLTNIGNITQTGTYTNNTNNRNFITSGKEITDLNSVWQNGITTGKDVGIQTFRYQSSASNRPTTGDNANWGLNIYSHAGSGGSYPYGIQFAGSNSDTKILYVRRFSNGSAGGWLQIPVGGNVANPIDFQITGVMRANNGYKLDSTTIIDNSRNLINIGTISSGAITASGTLTTGNITVNGATSGIEGGEIVLAGAGTNEAINIDNYTGIFRIFDGSSPAVRLSLDTSGNAVFAGTISSGAITSTGTSTFGVVTSSSYKVGASTVIDNSRNLLNIGTISSGVIAVQGTDPGNPSAATDQLKLSGYGVIGNRGSIYLTNSNASGQIVMGISGAHNANPKLTVTTSGITVGGNISATGAVSASSVGVTNIVTNKVVKFNGSILDDSNITDTGSAITLGSNTTVTGTIDSGAITSTGTSSFTNVNTRSDTFNKIYTITDQANAGIEFSSQNPSPDQKGNIFFQHGNSLSYGTGASFTINSTETLTVLADGNLMFKDGLYVKPSSGTGAGTQIITSARNLVNIGTISSGAITSTGAATFAGRTIMGGDGARVQVANSTAADTSNLYTLAVGSQSGNKSILAARDINTTAGGYQINGTTVIDSGRNITAAAITSTVINTGDATLLTLHHDTGADIAQQKSFIDFSFEDDNTNETPQVRIGAEIGQNGNADTQIKEGSGAFVVYTNNADTTSGAAGTSLAERLRVDYRGYVGINNATPSSLLDVNGTVTFKAAGNGWADNLNLMSSDGTNKWNLLVDDGFADGLRFGYNQSARVEFSTAGVVTATGFTTPGSISGGFTRAYVAGTNNVQTIVAVLGSNSTRPVLQFSESTANTINAGMSLEYNGQGSGATNYMSINAVTGASIFKVYSGGNVQLTGSAKLLFNNSSNFGVGAGGHNYNSVYVDTLESGSANDMLELVYYQGSGVRIGQSGSEKPLFCGAFTAGTISSGLVYANGGDAQHQFVSTSDAPLITKSTDATSGLGFVDNSATNYLFYRGSLNHFYFNSGTVGVGVASAGSGQALNVAGGIGISSTTVIDASRNLTNIGTISSGAITTSGNFVMTKAQPYVVIENTTEDGGGIVFNDNQAGAWPNASSQQFRMTYHSGNNSFVMGHDENSYTGFSFASGGNFTATGNVTAYSDERLKENIQTLDGKKALQMRGVSFTKDGKEGSGVIAQELEKVAPELVQDGEYKSVAYGNLVGYLIEAIKDQQKEIEYMKSEIKHLQENNNGN